MNSQLFSFIDPQRLYRCFASLTAIDSGSLRERTLGRRLQELFQPLGIRLDEDGAGGMLGGDCGNLFGTVPGSVDAEPLLFCAHLDTVEPSAGKRAVLEPDGRIHSGGGTILGADDCAGIAEILEALTVLQEHRLPHRPLELLFPVAEELYCGGSSQFDCSRLRAREAYVLDLSGPLGRAANQAPTILSFTLTVVGRAAHAGFAPEEGVHAIAAAADAVSRLQMGHTDPETTLNIGTISGGSGTNIVPERCTVRGEIRSFSHEAALRAASVCRRQFETSAAARGAAVDYQQKIHCHAYSVPARHAVVRRFAAACARCGQQPRLVPTFGGSDLNALALHGISGLVVANAMYNCHTCDEYTSLSELHAAAALTLALMLSEE